LYGGGFWNKVRQTFDKWADVWDNLPVLSLTDTIAFYTWFIVLIGYILWKNRCWSGLIPIVAELLMITTCMASPVNDCFRYYAPVAASTPALLSLLNKK
jgi:hypothetical protein